MQPPFMLPPDQMGMGRQVMTPMGLGMPVTPFMPLIKKPDFPPDMQMVFVIPQIANVGKQTDKVKCRKLDSVIAAGKHAEWILEKFEESWEHEERLASFLQNQPQEPKHPKKKDKFEKNREQIKKDLQEWNPFDGENITVDPYKTLFVARLSYQTTDKKLRKEFEQYGQIKNVHIVRDKLTGKSRGYAFIEFEHKSDFLEAYKYGEGKKIDGHRVIVDFERGRTSLKWRPRRLGGGLGDTRRSKSEELKKKENGVAEEIRKQRTRSQSKSYSPPKKHKRVEEEEFKRRRSPKRQEYGQRGGVKNEKQDYRREDRDIRGEREQEREREREREREKDRDRSRSRSNDKKQKRKREGGILELRPQDKDRKKEKKKHKKHRDNTDEPQFGQDMQPELGQIDDHDDHDRKKKKKKKNKDEKKKKKRE